MVFFNLLAFSLIIINIKIAYALYSNRWLLMANINETEAKSLADKNGFIYLSKVSLETFLLCFMSFIRLK